MSCLWREALNPMVDNAPDATKWAYAEMLAGWDLIRYLIAEQAGAANDRGLRHLVRAQTRTNAADTRWWRDQLNTLDDDLGRAEWLLAPTSGAAGTRLELGPEVESVRAAVSGSRLRVVDRAALWLRRPVRRVVSSAMAIDRLPQPVHSTSVRAPLLDIARSGRWLKVDAGPVYR